MNKVASTIIDGGEASGIKVAPLINKSDVDTDEDTDDGGDIDVAFNYASTQSLPMEHESDTMHNPLERHYFR